MDLISGQGGVGALAQQPLIIGLAVGQPPDAGVMTGLGRVGGEHVPLAGQGGIDFALDDLGRAIAESALNALGLGATGDGLGKPRLGGGDRQLSVHLAQSVGEDEVRRDHPQTRVTLHPLGFRIERFRHGVQPSDIGLGVGLGFDSVLTVQELGSARIGSPLLAHHIGGGALAHGGGEGVVAIGELGRIGAQFHGVDDAVADQAVLMTEAPIPQAAQGLELVRCKAVFRRDGGPGPIREPRLQRGVGALVEAEGGRAFGVSAQKILANVVKQARGLRVRVRSAPAGGGERGIGGQRRSPGGGGHQQTTTIK